jgi:hypothetical protein
VINAQTHNHRFETDLKYVAQNTHSPKGFRYRVCICCALCNAGTRRTILQVFDRIHLKFDGPEKRR